MDRLEEELAPHAQGVDIALAAFGVGKGSAKMADEEVRKIEITYPGLSHLRPRRAALVCCGVMTAAGADPEASTKYAKIIGEKEEDVEAVKFDFLGLYRPAVILGNSNTPCAWVLSCRCSTGRCRLATTRFTRTTWRAPWSRSRSRHSSRSRRATLPGAIVKILEYKEMELFFVSGDSTRREQFAISQARFRVCKRYTWRQGDGTSTTRAFTGNLKCIGARYCFGSNIFQTKQGEAPVMNASAPRPDSSSTMYRASLAPRLEEIRRQGWSEFRVPDMQDLVDLALTIGRPIPARINGPVVNHLRPTAPQSAYPRSMSRAVYGLGPLPFHTDGAFMGASAIRAAETFSGSTE